MSEILLHLKNMKNADFWTIVPACNEENRISEVLEKIKRYCDNIVVVDDGSKDNTFNVAKEKKVFVLKHIVNLGKGAALKTGCDFALRKNAKKIIVIDADGQHDPDEIPNFLKALENKDVVFGYRTMKKSMPFVFKIGNGFISKVAEMLFGIGINDSQCGYRAFTDEAYKKIRWKSTGYYVESEMIVNAGKNHLKYGEVPIKTIYADRYKGTTILDGIKIVLNMALWRLK